MSSSLGSVSERRSVSRSEARPALPCQVDARRVIGYNVTMIQTFRHKGLRALFETGRSGRVDTRLVRRLKILLARVDVAEQAADLPISGRPHELKGLRAGTWALWVSGNWRLTFRFEERDVWDVDLEDYH